jgi:hypothetical protein
LAGGKFEIVFYGRVSVRVILCRQPTFPREAIQIRHGLVSDYTSVVVIFFDDHENVIE